MTRAMTPRRVNAMAVIDRILLSYEHDMSDGRTADDGRGQISRAGRPVVTTYIRQQALFDDDEGGSGKGQDYSQFKTKYPPLAARSLQLIGLQPHQSRTQAGLRLLSSWDGRDALFQLAQALALLAYSLAPVQRKRLHIASEGVANARRMLVIGKWINEGGEVLQNAMKANGDDECNSDDTSDSDADADRNSAEAKETTLSHQVHDYAQSSWRRAWRKRLGSLSEYTLIAAEACELIALLGGSSVLWRVLGGKLAARQRKGLERIALIFVLLGFLLGLQHLELKRKQQLLRLRRANTKLLYATDMLAAEADAGTIFSAERLTAEQALSLDEKQKSKKDDESRQRHFSATEEKQRMRSGGDRQEARLRKAEQKLFLERKKMQLLRLERASMRAELIFVIAELFWPRHDHTRLESVTSLFAALCHMSRLTKETRWQRS